MKKILCMLLAMVVVVFASVNLVGCDSKNGDVIRIHIRANSNDVCDQDIKLEVRDGVIEYITPLIAECDDSEDVKNTLNSNLKNIENIADEILFSQGYNYKSEANIKNEYFPSRDYDGITFPADYYDALIINLGTGKGNNWWCVAYPPLCFVGDDLGTNEVKYRSKILELIERFFNL